MALRSFSENLLRGTRTPLPANVRFVPDTPTSIAILLQWEFNYIAHILDIAKATILLHIPSSGARGIRTPHTKGSWHKFPIYRFGLRVFCHSVHCSQYRGSTLLSTGLGRIRTSDMLPRREAPLPCDHQPSLVLCRMTCVEIRTPSFTRPISCEFTAITRSHEDSPDSSCSDICRCLQSPLHSTRDIAP